MENTLTMKPRSEDDELGVKMVKYTFHSVEGDLEQNAKDSLQDEEFERSR